MLVDWTSCFLWNEYPFFLKDLLIYNYEEEIEDDGKTEKKGEKKDFCFFVFY